MARDPNKYRDDEDVNELDDEEEEEDNFDGDDDSIGMEDESAGSVGRGRRGANSPSGRRDR
jgi:hypothetical protein